MAESGPISRAEAIAHKEFLDIAKQAREALEGRVGFSLAFIDAKSVEAACKLIREDMMAIIILTNAATKLTTTSMSRIALDTYKTLCNESIFEVESRAASYATLLLPRRTMSFAKYYCRLLAAFHALWILVSKRAV